MPTGVYKHRPHSKETRRKISESNRGVLRSEETKKKVSKNNACYWKNKKFSKEHKRKIAKFHKGTHLSEETKRKLSEVNKGEKSNFWRGGIYNEPYPVDWTKTLKRSIRERDKYICQLCGKSQGDIAFSIHHIDYNKKNCNPDNLITLCRSCHSRSGFKRKFWTKYFKKKLKK